MNNTLLCPIDVKGASWSPIGDWEGESVYERRLAKYFAARRGHHGRAIAYLPILAIPVNEVGLKLGRQEYE